MSDVQPPNIMFTVDNSGVVVSPNLTLLSDEQSPNIPSIITTLLKSKFVKSKLMSDVQP